MFNVGDELECIDTSGLLGSSITKGKIYICGTCSQGCVEVIDDNGCWNLYKESRFKLVKSANSQVTSVNGIGSGGVPIANQNNAANTFNVGDILLCRDDSGCGGLITNGKLYTCLSYAGFNVEIVDDMGNRNIFYEARFSFVSSPSVQTITSNVNHNVAPPINVRQPFAIGDRLECINDKNAQGQLTLGKIYQCQNVYTGVISIIDDQGILRNYTLYRFQLAIPITKFTVNPLDNIDISIKLSDIPTKDKKPCTCELKTIMNKGCQCGAVEKRQWGLRG